MSEHPGGEIEMAVRGVYWQRALSKDGKPVAYAVDSRGVKTKSFEVQHPARAEMAIVKLWEHLDTWDPSPETRRAAMRLIPLPMTEHRILLEEFDPYAVQPIIGRSFSRGFRRA